jgi:hypothetical protein
MSIFNTVVPPHPLAPILLSAINWAQPNDPEKKYPIMGRMRYAWLDKDNNVKILLKDGPNSWSEEKDEIMKQIVGHETFLHAEAYDRDPVYLVATFKPIKETSYSREFPVIEMLDVINTLDSAGSEKGFPSIYSHPFDLFDRAMLDMENGKTTSRMDRLGESIKNMLDQSLAEDSLGDMTKEAGIDGFEKQRVKILTVDPTGNLEDRTDQFMKKSDE